MIVSFSKRFFFFFNVKQDKTSDKTRQDKIIKLQTIVLVYKKHEQCLCACAWLVRNRSRNRMLACHSQFNWIYGQQLKQVVVCRMKRVSLTCHKSSNLICNLMPPRYKNVSFIWFLNGDKIVFPSGSSNATGQHNKTTLAHFICSCVSCWSKTNKIRCIHTPTTNKWLQAI